MSFIAKVIVRAHTDRHTADRRHYLDRKVTDKKCHTL